MKVFHFQYAVSMTQGWHSLECYNVALEIYEHYLFFVEQLVNAGIDRKLAEKEACRMEHCISEDSFQKLKESIKNRAGG